VTIKDIIAYNGFDSKGVGGHSLRVWLLIPILFSPFSPGFLYDRWKSTHLYGVEVYPWL